MASIEIEYKKPSIIDGHAQIYKSVSEVKQVRGLPLSFLIGNTLIYACFFFLSFKWWVIIPFFIQLLFMIIVGKKDPFILKMLIGNMFKPNHYVK